MGNCLPCSNTQSAIAYYPPWCLRKYSIDLTDISNIQNSWTTIVHPSDQSQIAIKTDGTYDTEIQTPKGTVSTPRNQVSVIDKSRSTSTTPTTQTTHISNLHSRTSSLGTQPAAQKISFSVFHERFLMRFLDLHPLAAINCVTSTGVMQTMIDILVNKNQISDDTYNHDIKSIAAELAYNGFKSEWYSSWGLCLIATLRENCDKWNSETEISWIKCYSKAMHRFARYIGNTDPSIPAGYDMPRNRRASIVTQMMQSYNLSSLRKT
jgi:hypothetical protein